MNEFYIRPFPERIDGAEDFVFLELGVLVDGDARGRPSKMRALVDFQAAREHGLRGLQLPIAEPPNVFGPRLVAPGYQSSTWSI
ncbi:MULTISPECIES: hypothetical protein [Mesorhizobium]|uniref:hypothetical protein n=1 Tax=Mesorhizobium TaxID=68287 RepID=UPI001482DA81|nr:MULTISPECIES: hypothetical protein [Mesorhizobium]